VIAVQALGLRAGRQTRGHRFEAQVEPVVLQDADHYAQQLEQQGAVIAGFEHRRAEIARQLQHAAAAQGLKPIDDAALLDEVTALVERPNVLQCQFDAEFLAVPSECLILTMKANQKYFPLLDAQGRLTNRFLVVSNIRPEDAGAIVQGNERVVRPRLADAKFFFDQDRKKRLEERLPMLDKVVYHAKLGSQGERVQRVRAIARAIASRVMQSSIVVPHDHVSRQLGNLSDRAAQLAKADLVTDMVGEFPELQGVMGRYYARHDGESEAVACAIEDHYKPRFAGDTLPSNEVGHVVALADKLETLVGLFGAGERPTGDKDPFALRRHALGVIRMLVESSFIDVPLPDLLSLASDSFAPQVVPTEEVKAFVYERLRGYLLDKHPQTTPSHVDAVSASGPHLLSGIYAQLIAVHDFVKLPEATSLAAANKRIANILKKSESAAPVAQIDPKRLVEPAERALHDAILNIAARADELFDEGQYTESLRALAALKAPVDAFFDGVMVNADDPALRANRLALLARLHLSMNRVADLSKLAA
jgi:glycyl-tRNA synthetase beta chain